MSEERRPFVKISDCAWEDVEIQQAGPWAELALYRGIQWSHRNDTDGFVPARTWAAIVVDLLGIGVDDDPVGTLVEYGQLVPVPGGHLIRAYGKWQQSHDERVREARRRGGIARAAGASREQGRFSGAGADASEPAGSHSRRSGQPSPAGDQHNSPAATPAPPAKRLEVRGQKPSASVVSDDEGFKLVPPPLHRPQKARPRDEAWEAFVEVCNVQDSDLTVARRRELNGMLKAIRKTILVPEEPGVSERQAQAAVIRARAENFGLTWSVPLTPETLTKRWAELAQPRQAGPKTGPQQAMAHAARLREQGR